MPAGRNYKTKQRAVANNGKNPAAAIHRRQAAGSILTAFTAPPKQLKLLNAGDRDRVFLEGPGHSDFFARVCDDLVLVRDLIDLAVFPNQYCR
jgi:hypothetical protein